MSYFTVMTVSKPLPPHGYEMNHKHDTKNDAHSILYVPYNRNNKNCYFWKLKAYLFSIHLKKILSTIDIYFTEKII